MEQETKGAVMIIAAISCIFALGFSIYLNNLFSEITMAYLDELIRGSESGSRMNYDYETLIGICDFDITDHSFRCMNQTSALSLDCSEAKKMGKGFRFMGPVDFNNCDWEKLDAAINDFSNIDQASRQQIVGLSTSLSLLKVIRSYRSSLSEIYANELLFSLESLSYVYGMLPLLSSAGRTWTEMIILLDTCEDVYNSTKKASDCADAMVDSFEATSAELLHGVAFDADWRASCSVFLKEMDIGHVSSYNSPAFYNLWVSMNSGAICSRMGDVYGKMLDGVMGQPLNKIEKIHIANIFHILNADTSGAWENKYAIYEATLDMTEMVEDKLGPEFQEAKDKIRENVAEAKEEIIRKSGVQEEINRIIDEQRGWL
jgi:hypothetical protein